MVVPMPPAVAELCTRSPTLIAMATLPLAEPPVAPPEAAVCVLGGWRVKDRHAVTPTPASASAATGGPSAEAPTTGVCGRQRGSDTTLVRRPTTECRGRRGCRAGALACQVSEGREGSAAAVATLPRMRVVCGIAPTREPEEAPPSAECSCSGETASPSVGLSIPGAATAVAAAAANGGGGGAGGGAANGGGGDGGGTAMEVATLVAAEARATASAPGGEVCEGGWAPGGCCSSGGGEEEGGGVTRGAGQRGAGVGAAARWLGRGPERWRARERRHRSTQRRRGRQRRRRRRRPSGRQALRRA